MIYYYKLINEIIVFTISAVLKIILSFFLDLYDYVYSIYLIKFFPGPLAFCKKAVERVRSEKNILNR